LFFYKYVLIINLASCLACRLVDKQKSTKKCRKVTSKVWKHWCEKFVNSLLLVFRQIQRTSRIGNSPTLVRKALLVPISWTHDIRTGNWIGIIEEDTGCGDTEKETWRARYSLTRSRLSSKSHSICASVPSGVKPSEGSTTMLPDGRGDGIRKEPKGRSHCRSSEEKELRARCHTRSRRRCNLWESRTSPLGSSPRDFLRQGFFSTPQEDNMTRCKCEGRTTARNGFEGVRTKECNKSPD
jgi:hypothetical protein